jgi:TolB-like protein/Tfp pilus assembly protein PilF
MTNSGDDQGALREAANIFVSYSRDDRADVLPIIQALEKAGLTVWWDGLLEAGTVFLHTTEQALEEADAVFVVWTETSVHSNWVRDEATSGRETGRLVPVTVDGSLPPLGFRQFQVADLSGWRGDPDAPEIHNIIQTIRSMMNQQTSPQRFSAKPAKQNLLTRRNAVIGGGLAIAATGSGILAWRSGWMGDDVATASSIAVMPFNNISGDPSQDYFAAGLCEGIRSTLSLNRRLQVVAKTSSNSFGDQELDAKEIASQLGVSYILDGSVQRAGDVVRIAAQLVDGITGFETWSESFDRKMTDIFAIQDEISTTVVDALVATMATSTIKSGPSMGGTLNSNAYDSFLKGQALYDLAADEETYRNALARFNEAIEQDSNYAAAYAAKSRTLTVIANRLTTGSEHMILYDRAIAAARQAFKIAPSQAEAYAALGFVLLNGKLDIKAASTPYQKSYELGFGNADILSAYAVFAGRIGKFKDAHRAIKRALKLDPLNPKTFRNAGIVEFAVRDYDAAISQLDQALLMNPKANGVNSMLGDIAIMRGQYKEAAGFFRAEPSKLLKQRGLAIVEEKVGNLAEAEQLLTDMIASMEENCLYQQAEIFSQWGNVEDAIQALLRAFERKDSGLVLLRNDPLLDPLRNERRFKDLQLKLGFE